MERFEDKKPENSIEKEFNVERLPTGASVRFVKGEGGDILPAMLIVHGWGSKVFAKQGIYGMSRDVITKDGYHSLSLSLRGHQFSEGDMREVTRAEHIEDIAAAIEYLKQKPEVDSSHLGALGTSYGAYLLSTLSSELPLELLALRAPALYPDKGFDESTMSAIRDPNLKNWRKNEHSPEDSKTLEAISRFTGDLLIVASGEDEDMPPEIRESYMDSATSAKSSTLEIIDGAKHSLDGDQRDRFVDILGNWLKTHREQGQK